MNEKKRATNRRVKLGLLALGLSTLAYALAKITNDTSGDWWRFSILATGLSLFVGGFLTVTDVLHMKFFKGN